MCPRSAPLETVTMEKVRSLFMPQGMWSWSPLENRVPWEGSGCPAQPQWDAHVAMFNSTGECVCVCLHAGKFVCEYLCAYEMFICVCVCEHVCMCVCFIACPPILCYLPGQ